MTETNTSQTEINLTTPQLLVDTAAARGFELDQLGVERLVGLVEHMPDNGAIFTENGLKIAPPGVVQAKGVPANNTSWIDFLPQVGDDNIIVEPNPQRGKTTRITLMGIEAFQDFILLADAGLIVKPMILFGRTNPTMAKFAQRVGFEATPALSGGVIASYDTVAKQIFSPEMLDVQKRLKQRQAATAAIGFLALAS